MSYPIHIETCETKALLELYIDRHSLLKIPTKIRLKSKRKEQDYRSYFENEIRDDSSPIFLYLGEVHRKATKYQGLFIYTYRENPFKHFQAKVIKDVLERHCKLLSEVYL